MIDERMSNWHRFLNLFTWRRVALLVLAMVVVLAGVWVLRTMGSWLTPAYVRSFLADLGALGPLVLIGSLAAVLVVPVVPASILQLSAGLAFGPILGLVYASVADVLGASIGFWLARRWGPQILTPRLSPSAQATLGRLSSRMSWRTVMLLRLIPGPAYPLVSFAAGYAPVGYGAFIAGSFTGVFPALVLMVFAGDLVMSSPLFATVLVVVIVAGMALLGRMINVAPTEPTR